MGHELKVFLEDKRICEEFRKVGVVPQEVPALFTLMDDGDDEVSFCEFLSGIMRLKNANQGADLPTTLYEIKRVLKRVLAVGEQVNEITQMLAPPKIGAEFEQELQKREKEADLRS